MKNFLKVDSLKKVFLHLGIMVILFMGMLIFFFYVYLPNATNHDKTITVPKLVGMNADKIESYLSERDLRYKINDSSYSPGTKPHTILNQHPLPNNKVKENRVIYVTIATQNPPNVVMPDFINSKTIDLRHAEMQLKQLDLVLGPIIEVPGTEGEIYDQLINGKRIQPGTLVPKGTKITLKVGKSDGEPVDVPDLIGYNISDAKTRCEELGLQLQVYPDGATGTIVKQRPESDEGVTVKKGEIIDVWVQ